MLAFVLLFFLCSAQALIGFSRSTDVHLMSEMSFIQTSHKLVQSAVLALTVCSPINVKQILLQVDLLSSGVCMLEFSNR